MRQNWNVSTRKIHFSFNWTMNGRSVLTHVLFKEPYNYSDMKPTKGKASTQNMFAIMIKYICWNFCWRSFSKELERIDHAWWNRYNSGFSVKFEQLDKKIRFLSLSLFPRMRRMSALSSWYMQIFFIFDLNYEKLPLAYHVPQINNAIQFRVLCENW